MKRRIPQFFVRGFFSFTYLAIGLCFLASPRSSAGQGAYKPTSLAKADLKTLVDGNNEFAFDLYALLSKKQGNLIFSPYSISSAMAMTYSGARGETAQQMAKALHFTLGQNKLHRTFRRLIDHLQDQKKPKRYYHLHVPNALWAQKALPFRKEFVQLNHEFYSASLKEVDFVGNRETARQTINHWVEKQTNQKIRDLLPRGAINAKTRLILTNSVYFQADWHTPFKKASTQPKPFWLSRKKRVLVPTMHQEGSFPYFDLGHSHMLDLPYKNGTASLIVLLPKKSMVSRRWKNCCRRRLTTLGGQVRR